MYFVLTCVWLCMSYCLCVCIVCAFGLCRVAYVCFVLMCGFCQRDMHYVVGYYCAVNVNLLKYVFVLCVVLCVFICVWCCDALLICGRCCVFVCIFIDCVGVSAMFICDVLCVCGLCLFVCYGCVCLLCVFV